MNTTIIDTHASIAGKTQLAAVSQVTLTDNFWAPRLKTNREETLPSQWLKLEESGCLDNFRKAAGKDVPFRGYWFQDTDLYKWLEAACWALASEDDPELRRLVDEGVALIVAAQQPDGYLNNHFLGDKAGERWATINTEFNHMHELYTAGHFFQAMVAHYRVTGSRALLDVAIRLADHIADSIGPEEGKKHGVDAHPEVEMGLVELFRITGERRYLDSALYQLDTRRGMGRINGAVYSFLPIREYDRVVGHAVCAVYLMAGATDAYAETGDESLRELTERIWNNITERQMHVTGGIGPRWDNEAFGADYELPGRTYAETCASIGAIMWNARMLAIDPQARYADMMELALYNSFLSGLSLDGKQYFYQNPLSDDGTHRRQAWFGCACCPPNVARLLAQLSGYFYSVSEGNVYVNLYAESQAQLTVPSPPHTLPEGDPAPALPKGGRRVEQDADGAIASSELSVSLTQKTSYPWDGRIEIRVEADGRFALNLRIPAWAKGAALSVNGEALPAPAPGAYAALDRDWNPGDVVVLDLPMPVRKVVANPRAHELAGKTALLRGPLVYCFERVDNPGVDIREIAVAPETEFQATFEPDLLGGVTVVKGNAHVIDDPAWDHQLYREIGDAKPVPSKTATVTAIPYYAWANREPGTMTVWAHRG